MSRRQHVIRTPSGDAWAMQDKGGFWGPYSKRPNKSDHLYFYGLVRALLDAGRLWGDLRRHPQGYPFKLLGQPTALRLEKEMVYRSREMALLLAGKRLESVTQRLHLLRAEWECFSVLAELRSQAGAHVER